MNKTTTTLIALGLLSLSACNSKFLGLESSTSEYSGQVLKASSYDVNLHPLNKVVCDPFGGTGTVSPDKGIMASLFYSTTAKYETTEDYVQKATRSRQRLFFTDMNVPTRVFSAGFSTQANDVVKDDNGEKLIEYFGIKFESMLMLSPNMPEGLYELGVLADDGVVVKAKINGTWQTLINNDQIHPTKMGCTNTMVQFNRNTALPIEVTYFQGPRYHISNVLMWRQTDASTVGRDAQCNKLGNKYFFDPDNGGQELQAYKDLTARGWRPVGADNFFIPMASSYNPCVEVTENPVITGFKMNEVATHDIFVSWTTDLPATSQVLITNTATGEQIMTTTDNMLRTSHNVRIGNLAADTEYTLQAVSIAEDLGKALSNEIKIRTLE